MHLHLHLHLINEKFKWKLQRLVHDDRITLSLLYKYLTLPLFRCCELLFLFYLQCACVCVNVREQRERERKRGIGERKLVALKVSSTVTSGPGVGIGILSRVKIFFVKLSNGGIWKIYGSSTYKCYLYVESSWPRWA